MIRENVELLIDEIGRQLKRGQASLMVGAGFSRNADTASPTTPLPPTWDELKNVFVDRLYETFPEQYRKDMINSKTVLQLAQEYDRLFERAGLNLLLRDLIRDADIFPGDIHKSLLQLPWRDVFTTNYDTLLERASNHVVEQKYSPVYCCDDLALSEPPRIIKLHGSIKSEATHLILTEEDYRRYPSDYAPFVNTVQQAIMETTLCLVGFSGTDPNFLKWIGWVRDNLKDSMPPIYLIGKLNISDSEYRVLTKYKINPVDLSVFGNQKNHKELLDIFISRIRPPSPMKWDLSTAPLHPSQQALQNSDVRKKEISNLRIKWKKQREQYYNWLVTPYKYRKELVARTEYWYCIPKWCLELPTPEDLQLLYEYNWRMEHCLMPIINSDVEHYTKILERHNPLNINAPDFFSKGASTISGEVNRATQCDMWIQLMFAVLRWLREENKEKDFKRYEKILQLTVDYYPEYLERLYYERALFAISLPDVKMLIQVMADWKKHLSAPEWALKYAAITAELENAEEAAELLKKTLPTIRQSIPRDNIKSNFYCLSLEGIVLTALIAYEQGKDLFERRNKKGDDESDKNRKMGQKSLAHVDIIGGKDRIFSATDTNKPPQPQPEGLKDNYRQRLTDLRAIYCDPNEELDIFRLSVSHISQLGSGEVEKRHFDITTKSSHITFGWDKNIISGYQFLRYLEMTGIPLCINHVTFVGNILTDAAKRVAPHSPFLAFAAFNRVGTTNQADYEFFFSQNIVYRLSQDEADNLLGRYVNAVQWLINNSCDKINAMMGNFYNNTLKKLLEAISRLVVKASPATLQVVFDLVMQFYDCGIQRIIVNDPLRNCVKRLFESMPDNMLCDNIEKILQIPVPNNEADARFFVNPFDYVDKSKRLEKKVNAKITTVLDVWLDRLNTDDNWLRGIALKVLFVSDELGLMTNKQRKAFAKEFFSKPDGEGLPAGTNFYPWVFLKVARFSEPAKDIEEKLLKRYKDFKFEFDCSGSWGRPSDYCFEMNCYSMLLNMSVTRGTSEYRLSYTSDDAWEIFKHIKSAVENLWKHINGLAENEKSGAKKNVRNNLLHIDRIVGEIVIPAINNQRRKFLQVKQFIQNAEKLQPFPSSQVALLRQDDDFPKELAQAFILAISTSDRDIFNLHSWAMLNAYIRANQNDGPMVPTNIFYSLVTAVGMRSDDIFRLACQTITAILDFYDMNQQECDLLLQYLDILEKETLFSTQDSRFPYDSRYDYRIAAGGLAARVYKKFHDLDPNSIPQVLQNWNSICHSATEFPSLRNKWEGIIDNAK